jgi:phytoene/squalene synthetase
MSISTKTIRHASMLLPKALRAPVGIIYQVVRTAADIGGAHRDDATIQMRRRGGALYRG